MGSDGFYIRDKISLENWKIFHGISVSDVCSFLIVFLQTGWYIKNIRNNKFSRFFEKFSCVMGVASREKWKMWCVYELT